MKKSYKWLGVILIILVSYSFAWAQSYYKSEKFYKQALENYNKGDYVAALKGKKALKEDRSGYEIQGGFEQTVQTWSGKYAYPKCNLYVKSQDMINNIIEKQITIKTGEEAFKKYFKIDNAYLPEILIRVGDLYEQDGDKENAKENYNLVIEIFTNEPDIISKAQERLNKLK